MIMLMAEQEGILTLGYRIINFRTFLYVIILKTLDQESYWRIKMILQTQHKY